MVVFQDWGEILIISDFLMTALFWWSRCGFFEDLAQTPQKYQVTPEPFWDFYLTLYFSPSTSKKHKTDHFQAHFLADQDKGLSRTLFWSRRPLFKFLCLQFLVKLNLFTFQGSKQAQAQDHSNTFTQNQENPLTPPLPLHSPLPTLTL